MTKIEELNKLKNDTEKWKYLIVEAKSADSSLYVLLDNDSTVIYDKNDPDDMLDPYCCEFEGYLGYGVCPSSLLIAVGVNFEVA